MNFVGSLSKPSIPPRFPAGSVIAGKYLVERELASGGVGVVVLATHLELGQKVAIKFLHTRLLKDAAIVERFKREARLAALLRSEHVVRIHDIGTGDDGAPFMVMEYLEGEDLGASLRRGPVAVETAIGWVLEACSALAEAHSHGIVHRDLKPENLFLARRRDGRPIVKVVDFGISKVRPDWRGHRTNLRMTQEHERFGTPLYMSPEQLRSSTNVDGRSDIWALGVVLFELLTTELPFAGEDLPMLISNILTSTPTPLRHRRPDAPPALEALVSSCLSREPLCRPANIEDLMSSLREIEHEALELAARRQAIAAGEPRSRSYESVPGLVVPLIPHLGTPPEAWAPFTQLQQKHKLSPQTIASIDAALPATMPPPAAESPLQQASFTRTSSSSLSMEIPGTRKVAWIRHVIVATSAVAFAAAVVATTVTLASGAATAVVRAPREGRTVSSPQRIGLLTTSSELKRASGSAPSASSSSRAPKKVAPVEKAPSTSPTADRADYMEFGDRQ